MENNSNNQPIPGPAPEPIQSTPAQPLPPQQPTQPAPNQIFSQPASTPQYNNPQPQNTSPHPFQLKALFLLSSELLVLSVSFSHG